MTARNNWEFGTCGQRAPKNKKWNVCTYERAPIYRGRETQMCLPPSSHSLGPSRAKLCQWLSGSSAVKLCQDALRLESLPTGKACPLRLASGQSFANAQRPVHPTLYFMSKPINLYPPAGQTPPRSLEARQRSNFAYGALVPSHTCGPHPEAR